MVQQRLLAVWKYEDDIGYLCGEITGFDENGYVTVEGYGGLRFTPLKILPYDEKYKEKLNELREKYDSKRNELRKTCKEEFEKFVHLE